MTNAILAQVPENCCLMPKTLTAGNGAKAALIGEFYTEHFVRCTECDGEGSEDEPCDACNNQGGQTVKTYIGWTTIKDIYRMAVEVCSITPVPAPTDIELRAERAVAQIQKISSIRYSSHEILQFKKIISAALRGEE